VTGALRFPPPPRATLAATSTAAHETYLRALGAGADSTRRALLEESVRLDSSFAPVWTALAAARLRGSPGDTLRPAEVARRVRQAVERALVLDSTSAEAHGILGELRFRYDWDWSGAEASLRRSIALNPNLPVSQLRLAHLLLVLGRVDESLQVARRALGLSPFDPVVRLHLARQALQLGDYVRAGEELDQVEARNPDVEGADLLRGLVLAATGRYPEAAVPLERAAADTTRSLEPLAVLGWVYALGGRRQEARDIQAWLQEAATTRYVSPYLLAFLADALGDRRSAFAALDRAVELRAPELVNLRIDARMDRLRVDRRYDAVARRIGLP
jgi:tetratricopeptide (TPR) repeat protein